MAKVTKADLVAAVAAATGLSKAAAERALDALGGIVTKELSRGNEVSIPSVGVCCVRNRAARNGRNPQTGAPMHIPAKKTVGFRASKNLKDAVN